MTSVMVHSQNMRRALVDDADGKPHGCVEELLQWTPIFQDEEVNSGIIDGGFRILAHVRRGHCKRET